MASEMSNPRSRLAAAGSHVPRSPNDITLDWLNGVLRNAGVLGTQGLESVEVLPTTAGFGAVCSYARLHLRYAQPLAGAPQSLFAKFSRDDPHSVRQSQREVRFYRDLAPRMKMRIPRCFFGATDTDTDHSLLLLEDMTDGRAGDSLSGCSTQEAEVLVREMAGFHAQWWENPSVQSAGERESFSEGD